MSEKVEKLCVRFASIRAIRVCPDSVKLGGADDRVQTAPSNLTCSGGGGAIRVGSKKNASFGARRSLGMCRGRHRAII